MFEINSISDYRKAVRLSREWNFGYDVFFLTSDGGTLSTKAEKKNRYNIIWSIVNNCDDEWKVIAIGNTCDIDREVICSDTGEVINEE